MEQKLNRIKRKLKFCFVPDQKYYLVQCMDKFLIPDKIKRSGNRIEVLTPYGWSSAKIICESANKKVILHSKKKHEQEFVTSINQKIANRCQDGLIVQPTPYGRGLFATKSFSINDFVVEYQGVLLSEKEGFAKELHLGNQSHYYLYFFRSANKKYCLDATVDDGSYGRLINHNMQGNVHPVVYTVGNIPHLLFLANRNIQEGEEILYDYGDRTAASRKSYPWLSPNIKEKRRQSLPNNLHTDKVSSENSSVKPNIIIKEIIQNPNYKIKIVTVDAQQELMKTVKQPFIIVDDILKHTSKAQTIPEPEPGISKRNRRSLYRPKSMEDVSFSEEDEPSPTQSKDTKLKASTRDLQIMNSETGGYCPFCSIPQTQFARHLRLVHSFHKHVKKAMNAGKKTAERRNLINKLRLQGLSKFNRKYDLKVPVRHRTTSFAGKKKQCFNCDNYFSIKTLRKHAKNCDIAM